MKIHYLINGLNGGGAAFPMVQVIGLMRELGHEVKVLALMRQDGKAAERLERAGIAHELLGEGPADLVRPGWRLLRRLRRDRPQLLWTSLTRATIYGQLAGRALGIPVVSWQHSDYLKPANLALLRRSRGLTRRWVADSDAVRRFAEREIGIAPQAIEVWPPFVADAQAPLAGAWNGVGPVRIGSLGRLHPSKQYDVLLRAFARAFELDPAIAGRVELHLGGDGAEREPLERLAAGLGIAAQVRFDGFVEPKAFLAGLHGYIQTSRKEGFCIAAHEAMQAGLPVISTRVGQLAQAVVPGETGWLCEVGDVDALARAMLALTADPAEAAALGEEGRARVLERYARVRFRAIGERLLETIAREIGAAAGPRPAAEAAPSTPR